MNATVPTASFRRVTWNETSESAIQRYIRQRPLHRKSYKAQQQASNVLDSLESSEDDTTSLGIDFDSAYADLERAAGATDNDMDSISAREERNAAREAEAMKHPQQ